MQIWVNVHQFAYLVFFLSNSNDNNLNEETCAPEYISGHDGRWWRVAAQNRHIYNHKITNCPISYVSRVGRAGPGPPAAHQSHNLCFIQFQLLFPISHTSQSLPESGRYIHILANANIFLILKIFSRRFYPLFYQYESRMHRICVTLIIP